jgi:hypothetical protein
MDVLLRIDEADNCLDDAIERWRTRIKDKVNKEWDTILAYLRYRWRVYSAEHPKRPTPKQVILHARLYSIPKPKQFSTNWYLPQSMPLARWRPRGQDSEEPPLEYYYPLPVSERMKQALYATAPGVPPFHWALAWKLEEVLIGGCFKPISQ